MSNHIVSVDDIELERMLDYEFEIDKYVEIRKWDMPRGLVPDIVFLII